MAAAVARAEARPTQERVAAARAALACAEQRTGARRVVPAHPGPGGATARPSGSAGATPGGAAPGVSLMLTARPPLAVPPSLAPLLPEGLRRGAVTTVHGSSWLLLGLLAHACADGSWAAVVGHPELGLLAAARAGVELSRLVLVPSPGDQAAVVLAALVDGVSVVVVGPQVRLPEADARRLTARVRERGAALLTTGPWPAAQVVLSSERVAWQGVGVGTGRVRSGSVRVRRSGRAGAGVPASVQVVLPLPLPAGLPGVQGAAPAESGRTVRRAGASATRWELAG